MNNFYLTLSSDEKNLHGQLNTASCFKVHLGHEIILNGKWEVGLSEIFFPNTLSILKIDDFGVFNTTPNHDDRALIIVPINEGDEGNIPHMDNETIVSFLKDILQELKIEVNHSREGYLILFRSSKVDPFELRFTEKMKSILGIHTNVVTLMDHYTAHRKVDFRRGLPAYLSVCTDLINPQFVGNSYHHVLSNVPINGDTYTFGLTGHHTFDNIKYYPLNQNRIDDVEIHIRNPNGLLSSFEFGTCTVTLHFRKLSSSS